MRTYAVSKAVQISATGFEPLEEQKKIPASELPIAPLDFGVISSSAVWLFEWALPLYTPLSPPPAEQVIAKSKSNTWGLTRCLFLASSRSAV